MLLGAWVLMVRGVLGGGWIEEGRSAYMAESSHPTEHRMWKCSTQDRTPRNDADASHSKCI
jgi:hypothetical protein